MKKQSIICILAALICLITTSCKEEKTADTKSKTVAAKYDFSQSTLNINRPKRDKTEPMGKEGTWTVFVYMCGSDLESRAGAASRDIEEMISSSANDKVKFVIETGGSVKWRNGASSNKLQRYEISDGKAELVDETANASMGLDTTLSDFLDWGIKNYPAANMGLILWNHGGGSINGVCLDEQFSPDSLLLRELDAALYSVYDKMTEPFEFIGFDACLMSSVEAASLLSTHSNYMIASEETEPGTGWDYVSVGNHLAENPESNGDELGREVCDSFYAACEQNGLANGVTMSVIDLRNIDTLLNGFDIFAKDIYEATADSEKIAPFFRNMYYTDRFGSNSVISGYTNMADLGGVIKAGFDYSNISEDLTNALNDCIVYKKNGLSHSNASGLSIYYPYGINIFSSDEMNIFKDITISSYYLGIVDKVVHGTIDSDISGYDNGDILMMFLSDWSSSSYSSSGSHYSYNLSSNNTWAYTQDHSYSGQSSILSLSTSPQLSEGHYSFTISSDTLHYAEHIQSSVYYWLEGNTEMFELGETGDVSADLSTGKVSDNFNGKWFALPDGQVLSVYLMETSDESDIYYSPIMLNDVRTNLRFSLNKKTGEADILDVCDSISESGMSSRSYYLEKDDTIKPIHYIRNKYSETEKNYYGKEYKFTGETKLTFAMLPEGEYWYSFRIIDIFGDWLETEPICFNVESGNDRIEFKEEHHKWLPATCLTPKTCAFCGATEGEAAGHNWKEATCTEPKICTVCGETEGKAAGHKWTDATFSEPKTCEICGETSGEPINVPIGSGYSDYTVLDVDNDGEDELVEIYSQTDNSKTTYKIYDNESDSYTYDIYGAMAGPKDYIVYDNSSGKTVMCRYVDARQITGLEDNNGNYIWCIKQDFDEAKVLRGEYGYGDKHYYIGSREVSMSQMADYANSIKVLYSYVDPNGEYLRVYDE